MSVRPRLSELQMQSPSAEVRTMADAERAHIVATLRETNWVVGGPGGAAARLGLPRTSLIARMQRLGLSMDPAMQTVRQMTRRSLAEHGAGSSVPEMPWANSAFERRPFRVAAAG